MKGACQIFYNPSGFNGFLAYLEEPLARFKMDWILFCIYFTINPIYIFISFHQHNHKQRHRRHLLWSCFDGCLSIYVGFVHWIQQDVSEVRGPFKKKYGIIWEFSPTLGGGFPIALDLKINIKSLQSQAKNSQNYSQNPQSKGGLFGKNSKTIP